MQPDGSTEFLPVYNNYSSLGISINQNIALTGGTVFINSNLNRFDNLDRKIKSYSAGILSVGIKQPLFGYNKLRWDKKIEPLKFEESKKRFSEEKEWISYQATIKYFQLLIAQSSYQIAKANLTNNKLLFKIANTRYDLGKISRNQLLQLQLAVVNSQKAMSIANLGKKSSTLNLLAYIGYSLQKKDQKLFLYIPDQLPLVSIDEELAFREALKNRSRATAFKRRLIQANSDLARVKAENGFNADLSLSFGLTNSERNFSSVYNTSQNKHQVSIGFILPITDWGRSKSKLKTALLYKELEEQSINMERDNFRLEVITEVEQFDLYKDQLKITLEATKLADLRYEISRQKFLMGKESTTDHNIALNEKDIAIRDYIISLKDFWRVFYRIRQLTLYDFEKNTSLLNLN